jgi:hypothetical protein
MGTLITWIPGSVDGKHEATRLHFRFRAYSNLKMPNELNKNELGNYPNLIVVGHRSEFDYTQQEQLTQSLKGSACKEVVLACCDSVVPVYEGPLRNNEYLSPAQALANRLNIQVWGTLRPLTFDEVGLGLAFAATFGAKITVARSPSDVLFPSPLWHACRPQSDVDELTDAMSRL